MIRTLRTLVTASILSVACAATASAGTLSTPILHLGGASQIVCIANNVSAQPVTVVVRIYSISNTVVTGTCTLAPSNRDGCVVALHNNAGHCRISVAGQTQAQTQASVRGLLYSRTISPMAILSTVEAR